MDSELFERLIHRLLKTPITKLDRPNEQLQEFEEKFCFDKSLQPMFTKEILLNIISDIETNIIYEIADDIKIHIALFRFENKIYIVGPYVRQELSQKDIEKILIENHFTSTYSVSFKLYYNSLSLIFHNQLYFIINSCISAFSPTTAEYIYKQVVQENTVSKEITDYAAAYSSMKPKEAAAIFDTMADDFELVAKILSAMSAEDRGKIMAQMREENAARITKIMEPGQ